MVETFGEALNSGFFLLWGVSNGGRIRGGGLGGGLEV